MSDLVVWLVSWMVGWLDISLSINPVSSLITFRKLQKAQLAYKEDSDSDSVCIIDVTSPAKDPDSQKQISVKIKCHSGIEQFPMKMVSFLFCCWQIFK